MSTFRPLLCLVFICSFFLFFPLVARARTFHIESRRYSFNPSTQEVKYEDSRVTLNSTSLSSKSIFYKKKDKTFRLVGDVSIENDELLIFAEKGTLNADTKQFTLYKASLYNVKTRVHMQADKIEKISEDTYLLTNVTINYCDINEDIWDMHAEALTYRVDDFANVTHSTFRIHHIPVIYFPYFSWNTIKTRSSGFLSPKLNIHNGEDTETQYGVRLRVPYFLALSKDQDITLTFDSMLRRGEGLHLQYRYAFEEDQFGQLDAFYLYESRFLRSIRYGSNSGTKAKHVSRYNYQWQHVQNLAGGHLFLSSYFNSDNQILSEYFQHDVSLIARTDNKANYVYSWDRGGFDVGIHNRANFLYETILDKDTDRKTRLNREPFIDIYHLFKPFKKMPFFLATKTNYTYFHRNKGWNSHTIGTNLTIGYPFIISFVHFYPTFTRSYSLYDITYKGQPNNNIDLKKQQGAHLLAANTSELEANFKLYRFFNNKNQTRRSKLEIQPRLIYRHVSDKNQRFLLDTDTTQTMSNTPNDYRLFDPMFHPLTYGEDNITTRLDVAYLKKDKNNTHIFPFVSLSLIQTFDLMKENNNPLAGHLYNGPRASLEERQIKTNRHALPFHFNIALETENNYKALLNYFYDYETKSLVETQTQFSTFLMNSILLSLSYHRNSKQYRALNGDLHEKENTYTIANLFSITQNLSLTINASWNADRKDNFLKQDPSIHRLERQLTSSNITLNWNQDCYRVSIQAYNRIQEHTENDIIKEYVDHGIYLYFWIQQISSEPLVEHTFSNGL